MTLPPSILKVRVDAGGGKKVRIWLPIFLIWPVVLALALILFPFVLLLGIILTMVGRKEGTLLLVAGPLLLNLICSARGLRLDVWQPNNSVYIELQ